MKLNISDESNRLMLGAISSGELFRNYYNSANISLKKDIIDYYGRLIKAYPSRREAEIQNNLKTEGLRYRIDKGVLYEGYLWYSSKQLN